MAVAVLQEPQAHVGKTYELTGPTALTLAEVVDVLTAHGRPTTFHDETVDEAYRSRQVYGAPAWEVEGWVSSYLAIADGSMSGVTDHVEQLTGHPPTTLQRVLASASG